MTKPRGRQRWAPTAPTPAANLLGYWYGLSGACAAILLELYQHPKGRRIGELLTMLETEAEPNIINVYVCHLRRCLRASFDVDVIETIRGATPSGPYSSCLETRFRLRPMAVEDVRECLEMAHEELSAILATKARAPGTFTAVAA